jgi:hypothetical protein
MRENGDLGNRGDTSIIKGADHRKCVSDDLIRIAALRASRAFHADAKSVIGDPLGDRSRICDTRAAKEPLKLKRAARKGRSKGTILSDSMKSRAKHESLLLTQWNGRIDEALNDRAKPRGDLIVARRCQRLKPDNVTSGHHAAEMCCDEGAAHPSIRHAQHGKKWIDNQLLNRPEKVVTWNNGSSTGHS